jgi:hypothetical protein
MGLPPDDDDDNWQPANTEKHHSWPDYLGGPEDQELLPMSRARHRRLHNDMQDFFGREHPKLCHGRWNNGAFVRFRTTPEERLKGLADFYRGPGAVYGDVADSFFGQFGHLIK